MRLPDMAAKSVIGVLKNSFKKLSFAMWCECTIGPTLFKILQFLRAHHNQETTNSTVSISTWGLKLHNMDYEQQIFPWGLSNYSTVAVAGYTEHSREQGPHRPTAPPPHIRSVTKLCNSKLRRIWEIIVNTQKKTFFIMRLTQKAA